MKLTKEEQEILDGKQGKTKAKIMRTLVEFGDLFGAEEFVDVTTSGHLVTSFGIGLLKPVYRIMDEIIDAGLKTPYPFTMDPRPIDYENVKCGLLNKLIFSKIMYSKQKLYEEQLSKIGLKDKNAFTCTCYLPEVGNTPKYGDILSWAESSAVVYANSVLGARCNRNSGMLDIFGALLGKVPKFGLLTDEGRRANWIIEVKTSSLPEAQILGSAIGMKVMEELQVKDPEKTYARWVKYVNEYEDGATLYDGFKEVFEAFDGKIIQAVASSKKKKQYEIDFLSKGLGKYIETAVLEEDTTKHKPDPEPILECLKRLNIKNEDAIYIGDTYSDYQTCKNAHVDFGLAKWGCTKEFETDSSCLIFSQPLDLLKLLDD